MTGKCYTERESGSRACRVLGCRSGGRPGPRAGGRCGGGRGACSGGGTADGDHGGSGAGWQLRGAFGNAWRALVLWSRCRLRSTWTRQRPIPAVTAWQAAEVSGRGSPAVAVPCRTEVIAARRAAVKEIWRG